MLTISRSLPRLLRAAAVLGSSLILAASTVAQAKDKVILQLDWLASGEKSAPYAGKALGYFGAEDIDVEIRRGTGAADSLNKIATGAATYAYCDISNVMMMRPKGVPAKAPCGDDANKAEIGVS